MLTLLCKINCLHRTWGLLKGFICCETHRWLFVEGSKSSCAWNFLVKYLQLHNSTSLQNISWLHSFPNFSKWVRKALHFYSVSLVNGTHPLLQKKGLLTVFISHSSNPKSCVTTHFSVNFPKDSLFLLTRQDSSGQVLRQAVLLILLFTTTESPWLLLHRKVIFPAKKQ